MAVGHAYPLSIYAQWWIDKKPAEETCEQLPYSRMLASMVRPRRGRHIVRDTQYDRVRVICYSHCLDDMKGGNIVDNYHDKLKHIDGDELSVIVVCF